MARETSAFGRFAALGAWVRTRVDTVRAPPLAEAQPVRLGSLLPYEDFIAYEGCHFVLLRDGSLGLAWNVAPLGHEVMTNAQVVGQVHSLTQALEGVAGEKATFQIIWDSSPSRRFAVPEYAEEPRTYAQRIMVERIEAIRRFAREPERDLRCMRRQLWLTLRWQRPGRLGLDESVPGFWGGTSTSSLEAAADRLAEDLRELREAVTLLEEGLRTAGVVARRCDAEAFVQLVRSGHHSVAARERGWIEYSPAEKVGEQCALEFVTAVPHAVQLGDVEPDTLQVLSWNQQPKEAFDGMLTVLLAMEEPLRVVMTIRRCDKLEDLDRSGFILRFAMDAVGKRQLADITDAQTRLAHNEKAYYVGLHIVVRNVNCSLNELRTRNAGQLVANRLKQKTGIPFVVETRAASLMYLQTVPLGYSPRSGEYTKRERRVLSGDVSKYMPVYGGFAGTDTHSQLMLSRASDPIWLSSRDGQASSHVAVLASSGAGKSFWLANYLCGDRALHPGSLDFIIDNKTSYEIYAELMGEEGGHALSKPPATFPNVFLGALDEDRIRVLVGILRAAICLASPSAEAELASEHSVVLAQALAKTFEANYVDARTIFRDGALSYRDARTVYVPRLSDVVDKFTQVCQEQDLSLELAQWLRTKLSPFYGRGPYASMFDSECVASTEPPTPAVTLIDLDGVSGDPILSTLTALICISDILRQVKRPENAGKTGRLVIEEAGVLGAKSKELEGFAQEAWKTFRKLGYSCIGLTNEVDDYRMKPAPRTIWQISPHKIILPMLHAELAKASTEDQMNGVPRLFASEHEAALVQSLKKIDGRYSEGFFMGEESRGTFMYYPTGFDYWLAVSKPVEVRTVHRLAKAIGGRRRYWQAVQWLARNKPNGFRLADNPREVREMSDVELGEALAVIHAGERGEEEAA